MASDWQADYAPRYGRCVTRVGEMSDSEREKKRESESGRKKEREKKRKRKKESKGVHAREKERQGKREGERDREKTITSSQITGSLSAETS